MLFSSSVEILSDIEIEPPESEDTAPLVDFDLSLLRAAWMCSREPMLLIDHYSVVIGANPAFATLIDGRLLPIGEPVDQVILCPDIGEAPRAYVLSGGRSRVPVELLYHSVAGNRTIIALTDLRSARLSDEVIVPRVFEEADRADKERHRADEVERARLDLEEAHRELVTTQGQLIRASRLAGMAEVASDMLHDVGNLLTSVVVGLSLAEEALGQSKVESLSRIARSACDEESELGSFLAGSPVGDHLQDYLESISTALAGEHRDLAAQLARVSDKTKRICDIISRQQSLAKYVPVIEVATLDAVVDEAIELVEAGLDPRVKISRDYSCHEAVELDRHKVLQIVTNLVKNAAEAAVEQNPTNPWVRISAAVNPCGWDVTVVDNGIGISAGQLSAIFAHGYTTKDYGHGFGLHSSALAARELGGTLTAASDGHGCGATFRLAFRVKPMSQT